VQLFACPFCGFRDETEFHFSGEAGNLRPEGFRDVSASEWSRYLFDRRNAKGAASEIWTHRTCGEVFVMDRNTVTHETSAVRALVAEPKP